jgi:hypothetical protein
MIGKLFQLNSKERHRREIIIALVPHVVPYGPCRQQRECEQFQRATTPLLYGPLNQMPRPYEPRFPDASQCLPLQDKLHRMKTLPDDGNWSPKYWPQRCLPGGPPVPTFGPMPFEALPEGFPTEDSGWTGTELVPTPEPTLGK